jgi:hypothetical protein
MTSDQYIWAQCDFMLKLMGKTGQFDTPHAMFTGLDGFKSIIFI